MQIQVAGQPGLVQRASFPTAGGALEQRMGRAQRGACAGLPHSQVLPTCTAQGSLGPAILWALLPSDFTRQCSPLPPPADFSFDSYGVLCHTT